MRSDFNSPRFGPHACVHFGVLAFAEWVALWHNDRSVLRANKEKLNTASPIGCAAPVTSAQFSMAWQHSVRSQCAGSLSVLLSSPHRL